MPTKLTSSCLMSLLAFGACSTNDGASPTQVQGSIELHSESFVDSINAFSDGIAANPGLERAFTSFDEVMLLTGLGSSDELEPLPAALGDEEEEFDPTQQLLELFSDENYVGGGNYTIPAELSCPAEDFFSPEELQDCIDQFNALELVIHVEEAGDGLDFDLRIGPASPLSIELRSTRISAVADLAEVKEAIEFVAAQSGEAAELPQQMSGVLAASFEIHGDLDASVYFSIREDVSVLGSIPGVGNVALEMAAADPMLSLRFDGVAESITALLDINRVQVEMPWESFDSESFASGVGKVDLGGFNATLSASADGAIAITNVGLGDSTTRVSLDSHDLFTLDLNSALGRSFDLAISADGSSPVFTFDPGFALDMSVDTTPLLDAGDDVDPNFANLDLQVSVASGMQSHNSGEMLKAVGGAIRLQANDVVVEAADGQCIEAIGPETSAVFGNLSVTECSAPAP